MIFIQTKISQCGASVVTFIVRYKILFNFNIHWKILWFKSEKNMFANFNPHHSHGDKINFVALFISAHHIHVVAVFFFLKFWVFYFIKPGICLRTLCEYFVKSFSFLLRLRAINNSPINANLCVESRWHTTIKCFFFFSLIFRLNWTLNLKKKKKIKLPSMTSQLIRVFLRNVKKIYFISIWGREHPLMTSRQGNEWVVSGMWTEDG